MKRRIASHVGESLVAPVENSWSGRSMSYRGRIGRILSRKTIPHSDQSPRTRPDIDSDPAQFESTLVHLPLWPRLIEVLPARRTFRYLQAALWHYAVVTAFLSANDVCGLDALRCIARIHHQL